MQPDGRSMVGRLSRASHGQKNGLAPPVPGHFFKKGPLSLATVGQACTSLVRQQHWAVGLYQPGPSIALGGGPVPAQSVSSPVP